MPRTHSFPCAILLLALAALPLQPRRAAAEASSAPAAPSPSQVLTALKDGNDRFIEGRALHPHASLTRREETSDKGQHPLLTCLSCSDSRVPVEVLFDQGVGDVFVVRDAGNVCGAEVTGTIEYGVEHLGTPLLVVMGHSKCGAVTAAATHAAVGGSIPAILNHILPAVDATCHAHPGFDAQALIPQIVTANVWQSIAEIYQKSGIVRELVHENKLMVVGAVYDIQSGHVQWLGRHPREKELLATTHEAPAQEHKQAAATPAHKATH